MLSYGQNLSLSFRVDRRDTRLSAEDLVLEGGGMRVAVPLIAQGNAYPNEDMQTYVFRFAAAALVGRGCCCFWLFALRRLCLSHLRLPESQTGSSHSERLLLFDGLVNP